MTEPGDKATLESFPASDMVCPVSLMDTEKELFKSD